jgi:hypothetical protein
LASPAEQPVGNGGEDHGIAKAGIRMQGFEALQVKPGCVLREPVQTFIEKPGIVFANAGGGEQQRLGIDDRAGLRRTGMPCHPEAAPLPPQKIERRFEGAFSKVGQ